MSEITLGSLFDGSGGFPLAGSLCGIVPKWAAEVEPYPIAVTRSRFPSMKHLGDISNINGAKIDPVDIITFGSPCQGLSQAGLRKGLEDNRSVLFMDAVRIIKEMREATNGRYPTFALWENVPGAFSSNKGEDFRIVLEELIKIVEPTAVMPEVPPGGWAYADSYCGNGWSLAYRVFDAQYWGVPQRRRRIHLVTDFRGERAQKVLFEREGVRGYFAEGRTPWQAAPADAEGRTGADDRAREGDGAGGRLDAVSGGFCPEQSAKTRGIGWEAEKSPTLRAGVVPGVVSAVAFIQKDMSATLGTSQDQYLFQPVPNLLLDDQGGQQINVRTDDKSPTLRAEAHGNVPAVLCKTYDDRGNRDGATANTITGDHENRIMDYKDPDIVAAPPNYIVRRLTPTECARLQGFPDRWGDIAIKGSLTDEEYAFWTEVRCTHAVINGKEPKTYGRDQMLTWYNKLHTDSAEYKMWGNGIALPPALYCMQGMVEAMG